MKKRILIVAALHLFLNLTSCSSDSGNDLTPTPDPPVVVIKTPKITSYSKNSGETGETISIYGENFPVKVSDITITFDGVPATIVSATTTEIKIILPKTEKVLPKVVFTILNREIENGVKNDYNGNIGVLPKPSIKEWFTIENVKKTDSKVYNMLVLSDKIMYYSMGDNGGSGVYRTLDGGITFKEWGRSGFSGAFSATINDEGWSDTAFGIQKVPVGGSAKVDFIKTTGGSYYSVYVDADMKNGTIISPIGNVFTTTNGVDFSKVYDAENIVEVYTDGSISGSFEIDNNHIWAVGEKKVGKINYPYVLFKNNETDGWKELYLASEPYSYVDEIAFADVANGYMLLRNSPSIILYKTINGGDKWSKVYTGEKFTKFTFKDANTGWAIVENKIYKTIDGATTWTLDYAHDQTIRSIAYKNNVVWAISADKIIKRYL